MKSIPGADIKALIGLDFASKMVKSGILLMILGFEIPLQISLWKKNLDEQAIFQNLEFLSCTDKYLIVQIELIVQQPRPQRTLDINFARARYRSIASIGSALDTSTISEAKSLTPCLGRYL